MSLTKNERLLLEAVNSMLQHDAKLGLSIHNSTEKQNSAERGYEYLHNQINDMFDLKASKFVHAESICAAFHAVHNYKYIDDPSFKTAMEKEMVAQAVPAEERHKAVTFIPKIIDELKGEQREWAEKDSGYHPDLASIIELSKPPQSFDFAIHDRNGYNKSNIKLDKPGHVRMGRTPSD